MPLGLVDLLEGVGDDGRRGARAPAQQDCARRIDLRIEPL